MTKLKTWVATLYDRKTLKEDAVAGLVEHAGILNVEKSGQTVQRNADGSPSIRRAG